MINNKIIMTIIKLEFRLVGEIENSIYSKSNSSIR